jgi:hypothetical protein
VLVGTAVYTALAISLEDIHGAGKLPIGRRGRAPPRSRAVSQTSSTAWSTRLVSANSSSPPVSFRLGRDHMGRSEHMGSHYKKGAL